MKLFNSDIDVKSFFKLGVKKNKEDFFVGLITGYQGTGKTFFGVYVLNKLPKERPIYTNIKSLHIPNRRVYYFEKIEEILDNYEEYSIFLIDELSKKYMGKDCRKDNALYSWLQQSRKTKRIVFMITQEYLQVPSWLRGVADTIFTTHKVKILPIFVTYKGIATIDEETKEWTIIPQKNIFIKELNILLNNMIHTNQCRLYSEFGNWFTNNYITTTI